MEWNVKYATIIMMKQIEGQILYHVGIPFVVNVWPRRSSMVYKRKCPTCRKPHKARIVLNLPINVALEKVIRNREKNKKRPLESDDEDSEDGGRCEMHKKSVLYFYCETHLSMVCRDCTVLEHPINKCTVISVKEHIKRRKKGNICKTSSNVTDINETLLRLNNFVDEKKEENYNRVQIYLDTMRRKLERVQIYFVEQNQLQCHRHQ